MNYALTQNPSLAMNDCLVLGIFLNRPMSGFAMQLDKENHGLITKLSQGLCESGDSLWQNDLQGRSLFIIQFGDQQSYTFSHLEKRLVDLAQALNKQKISSATLCLPQLAENTPDWQLEKMILKLDHQQYQFLDFKKKEPKINSLKSVTFYLPGSDEGTIHTAQAIASGVKLTRDLANMPANICTPTFLGEQAQAMATQFEMMSCKVLGPKEMEKLGMNTLLAVSQGSVQPPRLIEIQYKGGDDAASPIVFVGKGITFDSGGLSLKLGSIMDEMKYDMCGAASVLGALKACALLKLPINVVGIIASAENMPSGSAVKPGDVVTSMSGQTVEIINTDAEGRLVLADALTYAEGFNPKYVIDIATLTGAVIVALGKINTGLITKDDALAKLIEEAAIESKDKIWRLPLDDEYQEAIDSPIADMLNATFDRVAGSITGACFLSRFAQKFSWAHLDIAGTAWITGKHRNATGRPVYLLTQLLRQAANANTR
ncbi:MAG: leucyl aminopeptidase [Legionella sp.]|nr:leucyl aminopeptidase [Legionella sp.]